MQTLSSPYAGGSKVELMQRQNRFDRLYVLILALMLCCALRVEISQQVQDRQNQQQLLQLAQKPQACTQSQ